MFISNLNIASEAPKTGKWKKGDIFWNNCVNGDYNVKGWVCVEEGEPGKWNTLTFNLKKLLCSRLIQGKKSSMLVELVETDQPRFEDLNYEVQGTVFVGGYRFCEELLHAKGEFDQVLKDFDKICNAVARNMEYEEKEGDA